MASSRETRGCILDPLVVGTGLRLPERHGSVERGAVGAEQIMHYITWPDRRARPVRHTKFRWADPRQELTSGIVLVGMVRVIRKIPEGDQCNSAGAHGKRTEAEGGAGEGAAAGSMGAKKC